MSLQAQDIIDRYLRNGAAAERKEIEDNPSLKAQLAFTESLIGAAERQSLKQSIKKAKGSTNSWFGNLTLVLFSLLTVAISVYLLNNQKEQPTSKRYEAWQVNLQKGERPLIEEVDFTFSPQVVKLKPQKEEVQAVVKVAQKTEDTLTELPTKQYQLIELNNQKVDTVFGKEGSCLIFQAHSFGKKEEQIRLKLREYYRLEDILFSQLSTETIDGEYLESGGMVHLEAYTTNGDTAYLSKNYQIGFPVKEEPKTGMALYYGKEQDETVKWEKAQEEKQLVEEKGLNEVREIFTIVENMPSFEGGSNRDVKSLTEEFQKRIQVATRIPYTKEQLPDGKVYVNFVVDERGLIQGTRILRSLHPVLDQVAIKAIYSLPQMNPGTQRGVPVRVQYTVPIVFKEAAGDRTYSFEEFEAEMEQLIVE